MNWRIASCVLNGSVLSAVAVGSSARATAMARVVMRSGVAGASSLEWYDEVYSSI